MVGLFVVKFTEDDGNCIGGGCPCVMLYLVCRFLCGVCVCNCLDG